MSTTSKPPVIDFPTEEENAAILAVAKISSALSPVSTLFDSWLPSLGHHQPDSSCATTADK